MKRIHSIDFARGVAMIIMALDHVRDLIHIPSLTESPTNLATTSPILFFTRWITYLCAPTFVFLAGSSVYLSLKRSDIAEVRTILFKRGLYLLALEFVVVNYLLFFDIGFHTIIFEVIATIGFGFIVLAMLLRLSFKTIGVIGLLIIALHNLVGIIPIQDGSVIKSILTPLFNTTAFPFLDRVFVMAYPPIPWLGIMMVGFSSGKLFEMESARRRNLFLKLSVGALLLFVVIRYVNVYGDSVRWTVQPTGLYTVLSFLNVTKYPPSFVFCLSMLGLMFLLLVFGESLKNKFLDFVSVYGRVPLFYFLLHFFLIHVLLLIILVFQGFQLSDIQFASGTFGRPANVPTGLPLGAVYLLWIMVVAILYKPCQIFAAYKSTNNHWWLRYL